MAVAFTQLTVAEVEPTASARIAWGTVLGREEGRIPSLKWSHLEPTDQKPLSPASLHGLDSHWLLVGKSQAWPFSPAFFLWNLAPWLCVQFLNTLEAGAVSVPILPGISSCSEFTEIIVHP